jgi:hypothetical protein
VRRTITIAALAGATIIGGAASGAAPTAEAHQSGCHRAHTCPSDHATYRWRGLRCVSPASGESRQGYPRRVRYGGRVYYCKR